MMNFILLTTPRSGSTWLGSLLNDHPDVSMYGELFLPHDVPEKYQELRQHDPKKFFRFRESSPLRRPKVTTAYLDHVFNSAEKSVGFKLMAYPLITHPEIIFYCRKHNIHLIHLTRNTQDRVISYAIAEARNNFHTLEEQADNKEKIHLDIKRVRKLYKKQKTLANILKILVNNISCAQISIDYEELVKNQDETLQKIYALLDLSAHKPTSTLQKTTDLPYRDIIENFEEIERIFKK